MNWTACQVFINEFSELYPDWDTLACVASVLPVPGVPAEGQRESSSSCRMEVIWRKTEGQGIYEHSKLQRHIGHIGSQVGSRGLYHNEKKVKIKCYLVAFI